MKRPILGILFLTLLIGGVIYAIIKFGDEPATTRYEIYNQINDVRVQNGLKPLKFNPLMCTFADTRLKQIHTSYSHKGFNPEAKNYYSYKDAGENLAKDVGGPELITEWMESQGHKENILNPNYTDTCISNDKQYTVQEFASF